MITGWLAVLALALSGNLIWGLLLTATLLIVEHNWFKFQVH